MGGQERCQLDGVASPSGHGAKPELTNEPGYRSRDLCRDESRTRIALTFSWHQRGMEHSSGDDGRRIVWPRDFVGSGRGQSTQSNLQRIKRRCLSLAQLWNELAAFYELPIA